MYQAGCCYRMQCCALLFVMKFHHCVRMPLHLSICVYARARVCLSSHVADDGVFLRLIASLFPASCFCLRLCLCGSCVGTLWIASPLKHAGPCYPAIHLSY